MGGRDTVGVRAIVLVVDGAMRGNMRGCAEHQTRE